jgi:D-aminoacyl-tRNA deacylase
MRAVVQRVAWARVLVEGVPTAAIDRGLLALVGVANDDGPSDVQYIADKILALRVFDDGEGKMNLAVGEVRGAVLAVSQFTLQGDCRKGRRPSFDGAAPAPLARAFYDDVVALLRGSGLTVASGVFQARMSVELANDGPVTLLLDSRRQF